MNISEGARAIIRNRTCALLVGCIVLFFGGLAAAQPTYIFQKQIFTPIGGGKFSGISGLAVDPRNRNIIVGDSSSRVQIFNSAGVYLSTFGSYGKGNGEFVSPQSIAVDPGNGNIAVADGNGHVQVFSPAGVWKFSTEFVDDSFNPAGVVVDPSHNLIVYDSTRRMVHTFGPTGLRLRQFSIGGNNGGSCGPGFAVDPISRNVVVADCGNRTVLLFDQAGTLLKTVGTAGTGSGQFGFPTSVTIDPDNHTIFVSDLDNSRVQIFDSAGNFGGQFPVAFYAFYIAIDPVTKNIIVGDYYAFQVRIFNTSGVVLSSFGAKVSDVGQFRLPEGVAIDNANRNIVVADTVNCRMQVFNFSGVRQRTFGECGTGQGQFENGPYKVAVDPVGNVAVLDFGAPRVQIFDAMGAFVRQFGSTGSNPGQFQFATGIAIDPTSRNIVIADAANKNVQVFSQSGVLQAAWPANLQSTVNGVTTSDRFLDVGIDPVSHDVYVTGNSVQVFNGSGGFLRGFGTFGSNDGQLMAPSSVAIDPSTRNAVIVDSNGRGQIFDTSGKLVGKFASEGGGLGQFGNVVGSIAIDPTTRNLVVADAGHDRIQIFAPVNAVSYEGLWWKAPAASESGWGINLAHQGDVLFVTWFTYDLTGKAWWLTMTANKTADNTYSGALVQTRGPAFNSVPFNGSAVTASQVGTGTLTFADANTGTFAYTVNGASQTKAITRQVFGVMPTCAFGVQTDLTQAANYQDLWWAAPAQSESGWGVNFTHQGDTIFVTWFTYDFDGTPLWLSATVERTGTSVYTGTLVRTSGPAFNAVPFAPSSVVAAGVGSLAITFADGNTASFAYTVNLPGQPSVTQTKTLTRQVFRPPGTVCQ